ncbi:hypothetical protein ACIGZJ_17950 [Kitasatospora sp. NPDC052868]|uniref:hypothetical protein n=1 Tax=Kitasatospora sp. NPDC052868 TaxID=3364060 RepID=UPI0037C9D41D
MTARHLQTVVALSAAALLLALTAAVALFALRLGQAVECSRSLACPSRTADSAVTGVARAAADLGARTEAGRLDR